MLWGINRIMAGLPDSWSHVHLGIKQNYFKNKIDAERQQKKKKKSPRVPRGRLTLQREKNKQKLLFSLQLRRRRLK
jgi:hypothetical protein